MSNTQHDAQAALRKAAAYLRCARREVDESPQNEQGLMSGLTQEIKNMERQLYNLSLEPSQAIN